MKSYIYLLLGMAIYCASCVPQRSSSLQSSESSKAQFPWLVKVVTTYKNSQGQMTYTGKGFIVRYKDRMFVITNGHLTSGYKTSLFVGDKELNWIKTPVLNRRSNSILDLSLLEVSNSLQPLAELVTLKTTGEDLMDRNLKILRVVAPEFGNASVPDLKKKHADSKNFHSLSLGHFIPADQNTQTLESKSYDEHMQNFQQLILGKNIDYPIDQRYARFFLNSMAPFSRKKGVNRYLIGADILPGHSGSPVIAVDLVNERWLVTGTVASYHRTFSESYYTTPETGLFDMIEKFDAYPEPDTGWELENGEILRVGTLVKKKFQFRETSISLAKPTGDGVSGDGGDGVSGDGGDGVSGDGGDGVSGDGGDGVSGDGGDSYRKTKKVFKPGVFIKYSETKAPYQNVIAYQLLIGKHHELIYANMASLEFMESFSKLYPQIDLVKNSTTVNDPLVLTNIVTHWFAQFQPTLDDYELTLDIPFLLTQSHPWNRDLLKTTKVRIETQWKPHKNGKFLVDRARFTIFSESIGTLQMVFNRFGGLETKNNPMAPFKPLVTVQNEKGESFKLDLTNFLFKNLTVFEPGHLLTGHERIQSALQVWPKLRILSDDGKKYDLGAPFIPNKRFPDFVGQQK